jgi:hypothetical protein
MGRRDARRDPADGGEEGEHWGYVPALRSAGSWLVSRSSTSFVAFAPPGVPVDDTRRDDLTSWRRAGWEIPGLPCSGAPARKLDCVSIGAVLHEIPGDFHRWVHATTCDQIQTLRWFIATAPDSHPDPYLREARCTAQRLRAELAECGFPVTLGRSETFRLDSTTFASSGETHRP